MMASDSTTLGFKKRPWFNNKKTPFLFQIFNTKNLANLPIIKEDTFQDPFLIMEYKIQTCLSRYVCIGLKICKIIVVNDWQMKQLGCFLIITPINKMLYITTLQAQTNSTNND
jgi:hypothetical protein